MNYGKRIGQFGKTQQIEYVFLFYFSMLYVSSGFAEQLSLALVGFFFPSGTDHFDQQYGDAAQGASGHCGILTAHAKSFQAGLIFEK
ncbi:MAG: hypothetical protein P1P89_22380, partial [Desulfobacterales bacterium]|nr:hypothetical protein [Desulfobacterales bacterium]